MTLLETHHRNSCHPDLMCACSGEAPCFPQRPQPRHERRSDREGRGGWVPTSTPGRYPAPKTLRGHRPMNGLIEGAAMRTARGRRASPGTGETWGVARGRLLALRTAPQPPAARGGVAEAIWRGRRERALRLPALPPLSSPVRPAQARKHQLEALLRDPKRQKPLLDGLLLLPREHPSCTPRRHVELGSCRPGISRERLGACYCAYPAHHSLAGRCGACPGALS